MRLLILFTLFASGFTSPIFAQPVYLDQGWDDNEREEFYFTPQGSQLIPYKWFVALEQANSTNLFRDNENMRSYGIVTTTPSQRNPDGLPIGFVRDGADTEDGRFHALSDTEKKIVKAATRFGIKQAYLGSKFKEKFYPEEKNAWFGLTCAACHTHDIEYKGKSIRIDGGSTQADLESFLRDLGLALEATHKDGEKLRRFSKRLGRSDVILNLLKSEVEQIADAVNRLVERNRAKHPYGYARLDAFGAILNAVCETALQEPRNRRESNAPVSYPSLWNTPAMSQVQWAATADRAEKRNVGEVLGVFGCFSVEPGPNQFDSTVRLKNLLRLEHGLLAHLSAPDWPEELLGQLEIAKIELGQKLFRKNCQSCHPVRGENGEFALNEKNKIQVTSNTIEELNGSDAQFLKNLSLTDMVFTGNLSDQLPGQFNGQPKAPRLLVLATVVGNIMATLAKTEGVDLSKTDPGEQPPPHPMGMGSGYISRPLEGIWANAPYFHNGSVPNLYETLLPAAERSTSFKVGTREFDPVKVGFVVDAETGSQFNVLDDAGQPIPGNSNGGHEGFGANENEGFTQTFEDGEWRDFTEEERYALIEYMKSLTARKPAPVLENVPENEAEDIEALVALTARRMMKQYSRKRMLRGVHPKDHGCVTATFHVSESLSPEHVVGIFQPGKTYDALIRFSNASITVGDDSPIADTDTGQREHGSRGMAVKLLGVQGESLLPLHGSLTQDLLMVNQPSFAFANVHDYRLFNQDRKNFAANMMASGDPDAGKRLQETGKIVQRIKALSMEEGAFEKPPASPVDNSYYGAATFQFGLDRVMRFRVSPVARSMAEPNVVDPHYLRAALIDRLGKEDVMFDFCIQVRTADQLDIANDVENASSVWDDKFVTVGQITIPRQAFDSPEQRLKCEKLFFTPWHGITDHRPLGGINRLRKAVYEASARHRSLPKEPAPGW